MAENALLKSRLKLLQSQNDELLKAKEPVEVLRSEQRLILEDFEGEGRPSVGELWGDFVVVL
jgi:hypothetical protein